jgi:DnaJ-domain-containing protein 1
VIRAYRVTHHILKKKYPTKSQQDVEKYFDSARNRFLDFSILLSNLRKSANDFKTEKKLVERICNLAEGFKDEANDMTHSLYHIATKTEIGEKNFQQVLDLIALLEKSLNPQ